MKTAIRVSPQVVAIRPVSEASSEAELLVLVLNEDGTVLSHNIEVTAYVDRGVIKLPDGQWGQTIVTRTSDGLAKFLFTAQRDKLPWVNPGVATIAILTGSPESPETVDQVQIQVLGEPMLLTVTAAPATVNPGELVTVTATVQDAVGQDVEDGTSVRFITNPEATLTDEVVETRRGRCTTFLLTSSQQPAIYTIVAKVDEITAAARIVARHSSQTVA